MKTIAFVPLVLVLLSGCSQIDRIPDDQLAHDLNVGATHGVSFLLKAALKKFPADAAKITADAKLADTILLKTIIPVFSGADSAAVLRSSVDTALAALKNQIKDQRVIDSIDAGIDILLLNVQLPKIPDGKLDSRTVKALNGLFSGISAGIEQVFQPSPAPARAPLSLPNQ